MAIAYSPPDKVIHAEVDASTPDCLRNGLHGAFLKAGWEVDRAISEGYVYLLTSPQRESLQMKVKVQHTHRSIYPFFTGIVDVQFLSADETNQSTLFALIYGPGLKLRAHVTPCQLFTYRPAYLGHGTAVMGGIPFIDPQALTGEVRCADEDNDNKTTQAWWACSDLSTNDYVWGVSSFRTHWTAPCNATQHNSAFMRWVVSIGGENNANLRFVPANKSLHFLDGYANANFWYPIMMRWFGTEEPFRFDPFIAWNTSHPVKIRGQIWDAFLRARQVTVESPLSHDDLPFFAYSGTVPKTSPGWWYTAQDIATLYLRDPGITKFDCEGSTPSPDTAEESNYAY